MIVASYLANEISQVPITVSREIAPRFNRDNLSDESIAVILLGRVPNPDNYGRMKERSRELTDIQDQAAG